MAFGAAVSVPIYTSEYTFSRQPDPDLDGQDEQLYVDYESDVRGCTVYHSGSEAVAQGSRERVDARIMCDVPTNDVHHFDRVRDQTNGQEWYVSFVRVRQGFGLDHLVIGVYEVTGVARGTRDA